jgi:hypothetical protein
MISTRLTLQTLILSDLEVPEDAFVVRLRRGERAAIGAAYDLHQEAVCSFAKRLLRDTHAAGHSKRSRSISV